MKIAILSDVHGNLFAQDEVLNDINRQGIKIILSLGDNVGYGPFTNECLDSMKKIATYSVVGNHEIGIIDPELFSSWTVNTVAISALDISREMISEQGKEYIKSLPVKLDIPEYGITMAHGSILNASAFEYVRDENDMREEYLSLQTRIGLVGHTHIPFVFNKRRYREAFEMRELVFKGYSKVLINPGSVGWPRDGDPRASYCVLEIDENIIKVSIKRIKYDIEKTVAMINKLGLPESIGLKMKKGIG